MNARILALPVVLAIVYFAHLYIWRRLFRDVSLGPAFRRGGAALLISFALCFIVWPLLMRVFPTTAGDSVARVGFVWMGLAFYLLVTLGLSDLVTFVVRRQERRKLSANDPPPPSSDGLTLSRRELIARTAAAGATTAAAGMTGYGVFRAYAPAEVTEVPVKLDRLPRALSGLTIAQVSDIHVGVSIRRPFLEQMVAQVNALKPDVVTITGDLVDGTVEHLMPFVSALNGFQSRYGTYFITGNHEYYSGDEEWCDALAKMGIHVLRNRFLPVGDTGPGGASIDLVGVDDWSHRGSENGYDLERAVKGRDPSRAGVLLAHQPKGYEDAFRKGLGLQLSGHTHGGQFYPWAFAVKAAFPHIAGHYQEAGGSLYVSRGTGFWGPPVRVFAPPEIVKVVLTA